MRVVNGYHYVEGGVYLACPSIMWCLGDGKQWGDNPLVKHRGYLPKIFQPKTIISNSSLPAYGVLDFVKERDYPEPYQFFKKVNQDGIDRKVSIVLAKNFLKYAGMGGLIFWCHFRIPLFKADWDGKAMYANPDWGISWNGDDFWISAYLRGEYEMTPIDYARQIFAVSPVTNVFYVLRQSDPDEKIHLLDQVGIEVVCLR